jgi:hypothetical protein
MTDDMHHRETLDEIESRSFTDTDRNQQLRLNISMETRILRLEDEFWRIRTDTGELAGTERNALRAYLDEKGVKTAMIDDNLVIAGKLTWTEIFEPIQGFYEGKADVYPFLNLSPQKGEASTRLGKKRYPSPPPSRLNAGDPFPL